MPATPWSTAFTVAAMFPLKNLPNFSESITLEAAAEGSCDSETDVISGASVSIFVISTVLVAESPLPVVRTTVYVPFSVTVNEVLPLMLSPFKASSLMPEAP